MANSSSYHSKLNLILEYQIGQMFFTSLIMEEIMSTVNEHHLLVFGAEMHLGFSLLSMGTQVIGLIKMFQDSVMEFGTI